MISVKEMQELFLLKQFSYESKWRNQISLFHAMAKGLRSFPVGDGLRCEVSGSTCTATDNRSTRRRARLR